MRRGIVSITIALLTALTGACGGKDSVGSGVKVGPGSGGEGAIRDVTTTTKPASATSSTRSAVTTRPAATTTTRPIPEQIVKVQDDEQGAYFDPKVVQVQRGHKVTWQNVGVRGPRKIQADSGIFVSPPIPPGGSWSWIATTDGTFNYKDTTRPYTFGTVQVYG